jgi:hypothetical protein
MPTRDIPIFSKSAFGNPPYQSREIKRLTHGRFSRKGRSMTTTTCQRIYTKDGWGQVARAAIFIDIFGGNIATNAYGDSRLPKKIQYILQISYKVCWLLWLDANHFLGATTWWSCENGVSAWQCWGHGARWCCSASRRQCLLSGVIYGGMVAVLPVGGRCILLCLPLPLANSTRAWGRVGDWKRTFEVLCYPL